MNNAVKKRIINVVINVVKNYQSREENINVESNYVVLNIMKSIAIHAIQQSPTDNASSQAFAALLL